MVRCLTALCLLIAIGLAGTLIIERLNLSVAITIQPVQR